MRFRERLILLRFRRFVLGRCSSWLPLQGGCRRFEPVIALVAIYVVLLVAVVVTVDVVFFHGHAWERLIVNIGIVLVFAAFYFRFLKRSSD